VIGQNTLLRGYLFSTKKFYEKIKLKLNDNEGNFVNVIVSGNSWEPRHTLTNMKSIDKPYEWQTSLSKRIISVFKERGFCSAIISGSSGIGKTSISKIVAYELGFTRISNYNPSGPFGIAEMLHEYEGDGIVICFDDFDPHFTQKFNMPNSVNPDAKGKSTWNVLLDNIKDGAFNKRIIFIVTTNVKLEDIEGSMVNDSRFPVKHTENKK
jgi:hypothetical protein